jgi:large subunit ribosomal protein L24
LGLDRFSPAEAAWFRRGREDDISGESAVKIKAGDTVEVIQGNELGMRGTVRVAYPRKGKVVVEGVNIAIKHQRPIPAGRQQTQGGRIEVEAPIDVSNVMLICPSCQERTRVGYTIVEGGRKMRVCKRCKAQID